MLSNARRSLPPSRARWLISPKPHNKEQASNTRTQIKHELQELSILIPEETFGIEVVSKHYEFLYAGLSLVLALLRPDFKALSFHEAVDRGPWYYEEEDGGRGERRAKKYCYSANSFECEGWPLN